MQLGELLKLGGQIWSSCRRCRSWLWWGRRIVLLLRLRIGCALLISLVILLLRSRFLICIFLILVVVYCTGSAGNHRSRGSRTDYSSAYTSSSHHFDLHYSSNSLIAVPNNVRALSTICPEQSSGIVL